MDDHEFFLDPGVGAWSQSISFTPTEEEHVKGALVVLLGKQLKGSLVLFDNLRDLGPKGEVWAEWEFLDRNVAHPGNWGHGELHFRSMDCPKKWAEAFRFSWFRLPGNTQGDCGAILVAFGLLGVLGVLQLDILYKAELCLIECDRGIIFNSIGFVKTWLSVKENNKPLIRLTKMETV